MMIAVIYDNYFRKYSKRIKYRLVGSIANLEPIDETRHLLQHGKQKTTTKTASFQSLKYGIRKMPFPENDSEKIIHCQGIFQQTVALILIGLLEIKSQSKELAWIYSSHLIISWLSCEHACF
jgi:hypothetical protein